MNPLTYNAALLAGTAALGAGAALQWGLGCGLMVVGALVVGLTLFGALMAGREG